MTHANHDELLTDSEATSEDPSAPSFIDRPDSQIDSGSVARCLDDMAREKRELADQYLRRGTIVAAVACLAMGALEAQAQQGCCGHGIGYNGYGQSYLFGTRLYNNRIEQPPYFAMYPPVYYSNQIVRRPMGVSPFAAPPGVLPVEMQAAPQAVRIQNPFFGKKPAAQVKDSRKRTRQDNDT